MVLFFVFGLVKIEDIRVKRNKEATCVSRFWYYLLANAFEWRCLGLPIPTVRLPIRLFIRYLQIRSFFFSSLRVRNSKVLGLSRPEFFVSRTSKYRTTPILFLLMKTIIQLFSCAIFLLRWLFIFIIYYAFTLARR